MSQSQCDDCDCSVVLCSCTLCCRHQVPHSQQGVCQRRWGRSCALISFLSVEMSSYRDSHCGVWPLVQRRREVKIFPSFKLQKVVVPCYNLPFHATLPFNHFQGKCLLKANSASVSVWAGLRWIWQHPPLKSVVVLPEKDAFCSILSSVSLSCFSAVRSTDPPLSWLALTVLIMCATSWGSSREEIQSVGAVLCALRYVTPQRSWVTALLHSGTGQQVWCYSSSVQKHKLTKFTTLLWNTSHNDNWLMCSVVSPRK